MKVVGRFSVKKALKLIRTGNFSPDTVVAFDENSKIEALDALALGAAGVDVPESLICYDDDLIVDDDTFEGDWQVIDSGIEEEAKCFQMDKSK